MARRIQEVDQAPAIWELHHRGGDGNTTLLFHLHPVGFCVLPRLLSLDRAGFLDGLPKQQNLLCNGGFTRIRMRDNRKRAALGYFAGKAGHNW